MHQLEGNGGKGSELLVFSVASIMAATNNFSIENKLGQGGFGPVYKVIIFHVKRLCKNFISNSNLTKTICHEISKTGKANRWTRNCDKKAFKNVRARAFRIQE